MIRLDVNVIHFLNQFAQRSWFWDRLISNIGENEFLTGGFIMAIIWWAWFREAQSKIRDREIILSGIITSSAALFVARTIALLLPFRERPLRVPALHFRVPFGVPEQDALGWSSFPSDHAVLYFALATSIYLLSRKAGIIAYCHAFFIVCLPRVYRGIHYPTDIIAGALLGIALAGVFMIKEPRTVLARLPMRWLERSPASFYACLFLATFLIGTNFNPLTTMFVSIWHAIHHSL